MQCPFCTRIHTRGFGGSYSSIVRAPHCNHKSSPSFPSYCFAYSFSKRECTVAYGIDKPVGYFVALGAKAVESEVELLERALDELNREVGRTPDSKSWKQATEMITIDMEDKTLRCLHHIFRGEDTLTLKKLDHTTGRIISFGDLRDVEDYLRTSTEAELFLLGIDEVGKSALSLAACEKYPPITKFLLDHEAKPNHQDKDGRTPLMKAAL